MVIQWEILAGIRFFLAWVVLTSHASHFATHQNFLVRFNSFGGHAAVLGFLIISGFSIAHSISKNQERFYQRRFKRTYPLYITSIFISLVPLLMAQEDTKGYTLPTILNFVGNLLSLQGFFAFPLASNSVVWTLGVEFSCYVLAPFFLKLDKQYMLTLIFGSSAFYMLYPRLSSSFGNGTTTSVYGIPLLALLWAWLLGFYFFFYSRDKFAKILMIALGCLMIISSYSYYGDSYYGGGQLAIVTYCISAITLIYSSFIVMPKSLLSIFSYLGELSYPIYLFHIPALIFGYAVLKIHNSTVLIGLSLITSIFFYHLIDSPIRREKMVDSV
jgi:peptidoglycan/LPS O-acetylase OafA/YrhL